MKKNLTILLVALLLCFATFSPAFANTNVPAMDKTLKQISADDVPEGVVPTEFDNMEDALAYIKEIESEMDNETDLAITGAKKALPFMEPENPLTFSPMTVTTATGTQTKNVGTQDAGIAVYKMTVRYTYQYAIPTNKYFYSCENIHTDLYGINIDTEFTQTDSWYEIISMGRTLSAYSEGDYTVYLLISGLIQIYTGHREFHAVFSL